MDTLINVARLTAIKTGLEGLASQCAELSGRASLNEVKKVLDETSAALKDQWCASIDRVLTGTAKAEVTKESLKEWFGEIEDMLSEIVGLLVLTVAIDSGGQIDWQQDCEKLADEFDKVEQLVLAELSRLSAS